MFDYIWLTSKKGRRTPVLIAAAQNDLMTRMASGEIDTEDKKQKLLAAYAEELSRKLPEWEHLQVTLVAGAGFEPAAFRL